MKCCSRTYKSKFYCTFPQVHCLKNVCGYYSVSFSCLQELGDLFHLLKGHLSLWDLLNRLLTTRIQTVNESTEDLQTWTNGGDNDK